MPERDKQDIILEKVSSLEVAVCGHPQSAADEGLMGDVKHIRKVTEATVVRVEQAEEAIAAIVARCEERHNGAGSRADAFKQVSGKRKASFFGTMFTLIIAVIYSVGTWLGWWPPPPD